MVKFNDPSTTLEVWCFGAQNESQLELGVSGWLEPTYTVNGVTRFFESYSYEPRGNNCWSISITYRKNPDTSELSIDGGGGTYKRYQALETIETYSCDGTNVPHFDKAIGVTENSVEGVDLPGRDFEFSINKKLMKKSISGAYVMDLYKLRNKTNDAAFTITYLGFTLTFEEGTLMFVDFPSKFNSDWMVDITYKFKAQRSIVESDNFQIGSSGVITKKGWEYLWVYYREQNDATAGRVVRRPVSAYVERVLDPGDFSIIIL